MDIYIYDIEVFAYDWIVVARRPEDGSPHVVIHNDNYHLREWLSNIPEIIGGFNNRHYDDYVIRVMLEGGDNYEVKKCNDFIIGGGKPWEYPYLRYKKKPFKSFDLRDDIADEGISLKAIEGNLNLPIVESSVPFDIDRPLTAEELEEVIRYCKHDVDSTVALYWERKENYLDAKVLAGEMYGIDPLDALGYTNAKLSAIALEATYTERDDERDYILPSNLDPNKIPKEILDFFMQIRDKSIPDAVLFGAGKGAKGLTLPIWIRSSYGSCPVTYAWGGVHGAKPCVIVEETEDRVIINQDVASLYPNSMINFGYTSRAMADPDAYRKLVERRLGYKRNGDKQRANSLKLIINTVYGAMLAKGNGLNDRHHGRSVCITNQLAMTILISELCKSCKTIDFININTDGIMFTIDRKEVDLSETIVASWCELTGFEMERDDFYKVIQKDVNNYIGIYKDGHFKTKGGYVSLYEGGSFKTNSLRIIHKAIVDYLVKGIDPEETIRSETDITAFQQIVKTGGKFNGSYLYVDGKREELQKVNRIYAVNNPRYGQVVKGKWITEKRKKNKDTGLYESVAVDPPTWSETVISECPEHCYIDNENKLTVKDLDLNYYIDMAKKRIDKYLNMDKAKERELSKIKKEVVVMATESNLQTVPSNVYGKLIEARKRFLESGIKKQGVNTYAEYDYFRLEEIIPVKQKIFEELGLVDTICFNDKSAILRLVNVDNPEDKILFTSPLANDESMIKNPIQKIGAVQTYIRRYLYMLMLDIVEADAIEITTGKNEEPVKPVKKASKPKTETERQEIAKDLIDSDGEASDTQIKSIKRGLKKLREKDGSYEEYIAQSIKQIKSGLSKSQADDMLKEIGAKVNE